MSLVAFRTQRGLLCAARMRLWHRSLHSVASSVRDEHNRWHDRRDTNFILREVEQIEHDQEALGQVLDVCDRFVGTWGYVDPLLDQNPPKLVPASETSDGRAAVTTHPLTHEAYRAYLAAGLPQLPEVGLTFAEQCAASFIIGANFSANLLGYFTLTRCAADLLEAHGSEALKSRYLPRMRSMEWTGTMALSEPQSGSSLAGITTVATPLRGEAEAGPDGLVEYRIRGNKMWTSGAFHDLSGNIIHMLLARIEGAPGGNAGISLFLVPNVLDDGSKNDVDVISLNSKMGHRALSNCAWSLGDHSGGAVGYLVGEPHRGLSCMLMMMNAMRIEVGLGAAALGKRGFQESLLYAQEREQGGSKIIDYPDVRRMLLLQKVYAEGSYALCMFGASLADRAKDGDRSSGALLDTITEVIKSWPSEWALEANKLAIQVLGGAGYVKDFPCEQLYRDNRLNMIHEGTAGIHAKTLLGRKMANGRAAPLFVAIRQSIDEARATASGLRDPSESVTSAVLLECSAAVSEATDRLESVTQLLTSAENRGAALTNAHDFLTMTGHTVAAWMWLRMATAAARSLDASSSSRSLHGSLGHSEAASPPSDDPATLFYMGKLHACRFFCRHELPKTRAMADLLVSMDQTVAEMQPGWF